MCVCGVCISVCVGEVIEVRYFLVASSPRLHPDFISQPWRNSNFSPRLRDKIWAEAWGRGLYSCLLTLSLQDSGYFLSPESTFTSS